MCPWVSRIFSTVASIFVMAASMRSMSPPGSTIAAKPEAWTEDALYLPQTRAAFRRILNQGWTDALRIHRPGPEVYTFWDYQAGAWQKNDGIRIDHLLLTPQAADRLTAAEVDAWARGGEKPSDHAPVWIELDL